jgi:hypothetical protein
MFVFIGTWAPEGWGLFVSVSLMTLFQWLRHSVEWRGQKWIMNWEGCARKRSWPNFKLLLPPQNLPWGAEDIHEKSVTLSGLPTEIRTRSLPNTKQKC